MRAAAAATSAGARAAARGACRAFASTGDPIARPNSSHQWRDAEASYTHTCCACRWHEHHPCCCHAAPSWPGGAQRHEAVAGCTTCCVPSPVLRTTANSRAPFPHGGRGSRTGMTCIPGCIQRVPAGGAQQPRTAWEHNFQGIAGRLDWLTSLQPLQAVFASIHRHLLAEGTVDPGQVSRRVVPGCQQEHPAIPGHGNSADSGGQCRIACNARRCPPSLHVGTSPASRLPDS